MMPPAISAVDLDNYSSSEGFLGYFERVEPTPRRQAALSAIGAVLPHFADGEVATNCHLFGSVDVARQSYEISDPDVSGLLEPLLGCGLVTSCVDMSAVPPLQLHSSVDSHQLAQLCLAIMDVDGVCGHLFLHKDGLASYPHEDIGFGFFAAGSQGTARGKQILQEMTRGPWR